MLITFRWLLWTTIAVLITSVLALCVAYFLATQSLPNHNKTLPVTGLKDTVEIVYDSSSVPHIYGQSDEDVFFGLGYSHAQNRLWQMTILRRTIQGRLSEVFGPRTQSVDELMRRLALYQLAQESVHFQDQYTTDALKAYSAGVNARLNEISEKSLGRGAPEMFLFNAPVNLWQPADSLAIIKLMGVQLAAHLSNEVLRARVEMRLQNVERLRDIMPDAPGDGIAAIARFTDLFSNFPRNANRIPDPDHWLSPFQNRKLAGASNAFAAAQHRSTTNSTLMANDPHLGFTAPSIWYLARLNLAKGDVIGGTIPGIPVIMSGRTEQIAWGLTSSYLDDQDLYLEKLNPDNPEEYLTPDGYKPFKAQTSSIKINGEDPVSIALRWTENGPILPSSHYSIDTITPIGHVASLAWTLLNHKDTTMTAAMRIMGAQNVQEALSHTELFIAPSQILTVIDRDNIAMKLMGAMPRRRSDHVTQGRLPSPGWNSENRWNGRLPDTLNPRFTNPEGGILGNTNNKIIERDFPNHVSFHWGDTQRVNRWLKLMQTREVHTRDSFMETQLDTVSFSARSLLPLIGAELWFTGEATAQDTFDRTRQVALELLADWNGEMNEHIPEPLLYASWIRALQKRLIQDELGDVADAFTHVEPIFIERVFRNIEGASIWCDVIQSSTIESCADIAKQSLDDALTTIIEQYGADIESLRWGDAHEATHDHPVLGRLPIFKPFVNIRQSTSGGDNTLQRGVTSGIEPNPYYSVHGAAYRGVYDLADPDSSLFIISTGQSGHPLSPHYEDLAQLWRRGEYITMSLDDDLARAGAIGITVLKPIEKLAKTGR
ncbi:MAG: penicillin acylase family protein [Aestuariivita sp.]|nr:penicillin acylase family protein [Aestuariivita sp.]